MSRVDEEREHARVEQRLAEAKRTTEAKKTERVANDAGFSKRVANQQNESVKTSKQAQAKQESAGRSAVAQLLHESEASTSAHADEARMREGQRQEGASASAKHTAQGRQASQSATAQRASQKGQQTQISDDHEHSSAAQGRANDLGAVGRASDGRKVDAKVQREMLSERGSGADAKSDGAASEGASGAHGEKGDLKADADKGGQSGGGGDKKDQGAGPALRFNPALMAPVGVAVPKQVSGSERLRKLAAEMAQKIVERVRIGTNQAGKVEFQIDLRSDVLSGLSVKVSSNNGKIKATFTGSNKEVLKLIEEQGEALKSALAARGLTLEDFKVERRA